EMCRRDISSPSPPSPLIIIFLMVQLGSILSYPISIVLLVGLMIRVIIAIYLPAGYDEAYYFIYTQNLDWSYFDHPVFVALTTGLGVWLTGEVNQFTIRIGTLIITTGSLYCLYLTGKKLFNHQSGLLTLIIASMIPIFTVAFGVLTLPDVPLMFFLTLTILFACDEFFSDEDQLTYKPSYRLVLIGLWLGLACLSKYHGFVFGLSLVGFCLFNPPYRKVFASPWLIATFGVFIITLFPLLYWNWQHDWVSFGFQLSTRFDSPNPTPLTINLLNILVVALVSIAYLFPSFGFPLWWVGGVTLDSELRGKSNLRYQLILWISLPLIIGFTLLGGVTQILPTWAMPGFWFLTLILGDFSARWSKYHPKLIQRWLFFSFLIINTLIVIALSHFSLGLFQKPNQNAFFTGLIPPENDPSTELIDIVQLRSNLESSPEFTTALQQADFIFTNQYYLGGYIGMAIEPLTNIPLTCFSSDNRGFDYWYPQAKLKGKRGLYITTERFTEKEIEEKYRQHFEQWREVTQIPLVRSGAITEVFYIYEGINLISVPFKQ
ncbi:ArnT family glycosyltransferase, partial [Geminocystis sp. CENA526]|uniref:ArnT family glycosyltransferase n=1 Tax=Geminocystis sp. CENA526 TaxID=1355871 RepID=UPI003D6EE5D2